MRIGIQIPCPLLNCPCSSRLLKISLTQQRRFYVFERTDLVL